jgi:hypothetical protein
VLTDVALENGHLLRCNISLPGCEVGFPTLMQVRWTRESSVYFGRYISGLQFLF